MGTSWGTMLTPLPMNSWPYSTDQTCLTARTGGGTDLYLQTATLLPILEAELIPPRLPKCLSKYSPIIWGTSILPCYPSDQNKTPLKPEKLLASMLEFLLVLPGYSCTSSRNGGWI